MHNINLAIENRNDLIQSHAYYFPPRILVHELPNDSIICSKRDRSPTPALILFFPLHSSLFSPSSFIRCPRQNFSTRDISRYEWGATGTIFPSSCYPVSFFAVARPRDLSFAAARFQSALRFFLALSLFFSPASVQRNVAASVQLHHSCSAEPFLERSFRGRRLFRAYFRYELLGTNLPRKRFKSIYGNIRDCSSSRRFCSNLSRISDYPIETSIIPGIISPRVSQSVYIDLTSRQHVSRVRPVALIINYLLIP